MLTALPMILVSRITAEAPLPMWIPPATAPRPTESGRDATSEALLLLTELPATDTVPPSAKRPPASALRAFGPEAVASLSSIEESIKVNDPCRLKIPPPSASLARLDRPDAEPTRLLLTVVFARVNDPQLSIPPPAASAKGHGPPGQTAPPEGTVRVGATR